MLRRSASRRSTRKQHGGVILTGADFARPRSQPGDPFDEEKDFQYRKTPVSDTDFGHFKTDLWHGPEVVAILESKGFRNERQLLELVKYLDHPTQVLLEVYFKHIGINKPFYYADKLQEKAHKVFDDYTAPNYRIDLEPAEFYLNQEYPVDINKIMLGFSKDLAWERRKHLIPGHLIARGNTLRRRRASRRTSRK